MSDFIKALMNKSQRFNVLISFNYKGENKTLSAVIDTGCKRSHFSANLLYDITLGNSEEEDDKAFEELRSLKEHTIRTGVHTSIGRGVESHGKRIKIPETLEEKINNKNIRTFEEVKDVRVAGHKLGDYVVRVSYDTTDVALIGMDFIREWDMHIGESDGNIVLLACHRDSVNENYYRELDKLFDLKNKLVFMSV